MYRESYGFNKRGGSQGGFREPYLDRTEAYYAGSRPGPSQRGGYNKGKSPSQKSYKKEKEDRFREKKGAEVLASYQKDLSKSLLCGFESMEEVMKAKEYENKARSVAVPVSTRAVGISVVNTYNKATATENNRARLPNVTIFQLYRVMLAMTERKIFDNRLLANLDDRDEWYDPVPFDQYKTVITSINVSTQQVGALLRCIPSFKYDEINFVPLFPSVRRNDAGQLIPTPEVVYLTNLRETALSLANQAIPVQIRRNFMNKNSLPGARFNANAVLVNPDEIIPANYDADALRNDLYAVKSWIEAASDLKVSKEKWFTKISLAENNHGNESVLVSNASEDLRIQTDELQPGVFRHSVLGDVREYWYRSKMGDQMIFYGTYHLSGELASVVRYIYPAYCTRTKGACGNSTVRSFKEVVLAIED